MFARWLSPHSLRLIVATNTISQLAGRAVSVLSMAIISFMIAKRFGPEGYGDFVKITTYAAFFYTLSDFGLNAVYVQRAVGTSEQPLRIRLWQSLFGLRVMMGTVLIAIALSLLWFLPGSSAQGYTPLVQLGIILLSPVLLAHATTTTTNAWFQRLLRYDLATAAQNAGSLVMLVVALVLFLVSTVNGAIVGVAALLLGSGVTALTALYFVRQTHGVISPIIQWHSMVNDLRRALPLGLTLVFNLIYFHSDSVVLTVARSTHEVGIYGLAYKVFELPLVLPIFFMNAVYPVLLQAHTQSTKHAQNIFWQSSAFLLVSSFVIAMILWGAAPLLILVRPDFVESILPLRVLLLGLPIFFVSALFMWVLIAQNKQWQLLTIHAVTMVVNIALNILLIPKYGYMAAAWNTVCSELLILIVSGMVVFRTRLFATKGVYSG